jgi:arabinose-5-phosphate isomerase
VITNVVVITVASTARIDQRSDASWTRRIGLLRFRYTLAAMAGEPFATAAAALLAAGQRNEAALAAATGLLDGAACTWCTGLGKSGLVARKLAGTLASLGRRAAWIHPVDALHGDGGAVVPGDVLVAISHSGRTGETLRFARESGLAIVAVTTPGSPLAGLARVVLDASVVEEVGGAVPSTSFLVACALVDGLALRLGGTLRHPGGVIGALQRPVRDYMLPPPIVGRDLPLASVIPLLVHGAVLVEGGGILTDGDLRRAVGAGRLGGTVGDAATWRPVTVGPDEPAGAALEKMERRSSQISVLPVVEGDRFVGLLRLHDLVKAGMAT